MKKRRELNALVSGKQSSNGGVRLTPKNGKHELLRNDSESSDVEEFSLPEENAARKRARATAVCSSCLTLLLVFLLVSCIVAVCGVFILHFKLKSEVDQLRYEISGEKLKHLSNQIGDLRTVQQELKKSLDELEKGEKGLERTRLNVTQLIQQVAVLNVTTKTVSESIASASQILNLPQQVNNLSKNIASIGSNVEALQGDIKKLTNTETTLEQKVTDLDAKIITLQLETVSKGNADKRPTQDSSSNSSDLEKLVRSVSSMNHSLEQHITELVTRSAEHDMSLGELRNYTSLINTRLTFLEVKSSETNSPSHLLNSSDSEEFSKLKNQLSSLQAQCGNDSAHIVELMNEVSNVARLTSRIIKSTDSRLQYLNSTVETLQTDVHALQRVARGEHTYDVDKSSFSVLPANFAQDKPVKHAQEVDVTGGAESVDEGQQSVSSSSSTVQPHTSSAGTETHITTSKNAGDGKDKNAENFKDSSRIKRNRYRP